MGFNNRKKYFINKDFQSRFILRFVLIATFWAAASVMLFAFLAQRRLNGIRYSSYVDIKTTGELLLPITAAAHVISLLVIAGILAYTLHSLWRRLSPPLGKIRQAISKMAGGELTEAIVLGKADEFQNLAVELDGLRVALREKIIRIKEQHSALASASDALNRAIRDGNLSESHALAVRSAVEKLKRGVQEFHS